MLPPFQTCYSQKQINEGLSAYGILRSGKCLDDEEVIKAKQAASTHLMAFRCPLQQRPADISSAGILQHRPLLLHCLPETLLWDEASSALGCSVSDHLANHLEGME